MGNVFWTVASSIVTAIITVRTTYCGDALIALRTSRSELYSMLFKNIDRLINDNELVYEKEFIVFLMDTKNAVKLIASNYVVEKYELLFDVCIKKWEDYNMFVCENDPRDASQDDNNMMPVTDMDIQIFENKERNYRNSNAPDYDELRPLIKAILNEMRYDLGNQTYKRYLAITKKYFLQLVKWVSKKQKPLHLYRK